MQDIYGIPVSSPESVKEWNNIFIIVAVERGKKEMFMRKETEKHYHESSGF